MRKFKFKKGAASFYVVAFSTLILLIIAASFTSLVVAQITRTSNADLAQSAYDSAMAGVEDAKMAFYSYRNCLAQGATAKPPVEGEDLGCDQIVYLMENPTENDCGVVAQILARNDGESEVQIKEGSDNNMDQAYTCVKIQTKLNDYSASLSSDEQMRVLRPRFENGVSANDISQIRISWSANNVNKTQFSTFNGGAFPSATNLTSTLDPPVLSFALVQAGESFNLSDFDRVDNGQTNRGTVFLVPKNIEKSIGSAMKTGYTYRGDNKILASDLVKSNDKLSQNVPYIIDCDPNRDSYMCSALIELPKPIGGVRSDANFVVAVSLPYGKPAVDFSLQFCTGTGICDSTIIEGGEESGSKTVGLKGMQIGVDATGRANDLFRRVETRLEGKDDSLLSIMGPLELFGDSSINGGSGNGTGIGGKALEKNFPVMCEYPPFVDTPTCP